MFDKNTIPGTTNEDGEWSSDEILESTLINWRPSFNTGWLSMGYISDEQIALLKTQFTTSELIGPDDIKYLGDPVQGGEEGCGDGANYVPIYWQYNDSQPVLTLYFLSSEHVNYLKSSDLHNANLANNTYLGPGRIICFSIGRTN